MIGPTIGKRVKGIERLHEMAGRVIGPSNVRIAWRVARTALRTAASVSNNAAAAVMKSAINSWTITHGTTFGRTIPTGLDGGGIGRIAGRLGA